MTRTEPPPRPAPHARAARRRAGHVAVGVLTAAAAALTLAAAWADLDGAPVLAGRLQLAAAAAIAVPFLAWLRLLVEYKPARPLNRHEVTARAIPGPRREPPAMRPLPPPRIVGTAPRPALPPASPPARAALPR